MKIFYAVQATGNGHISRAMELLPYLEQYGHVDIFLSGANSTLQLDANIKYRSKGLCLFYNSLGGLDYLGTIQKFSPFRIIKEVQDLPVDKYDLVLNDFECITAMACAIKKIPSVNFGHQASFQSSKTPRPLQKNWMGELILQNYARATQYIGLHFKSYDDFILPPVIKKEILNADPADKGHIAVYLSSYSDQELKGYFSLFKNFHFQIFSKEISTAAKEGNISFIPVSKEAFNQSLINCHGIITGAGFETPAEALHLGKKLMVIPINGQYEQSCNAAALEKLGVVSAHGLNNGFSEIFERWINSSSQISLSTEHTTQSIVSFLMHNCTGINKYDFDLPYPELTFS